MFLVCASNTNILLYTLYVYLNILACIIFVDEYCLYKKNLTQDKLFKKTCIK